MDFEPYIIPLAIGAIAGGTAGFMLRTGFGVVGNVIIGLVGGVIGRWIFTNVGIHVEGEWVGPIVTSTVGALFVMMFVKIGNREH